MLCDEMQAATYLAIEYPKFDAIQELIKASRKFVLAPDFTAAADGLIENVKELDRITPFCRLPFPLCWFELCQSERPHFMAAPMHYQQFQRPPKRVGFLCYASEPDKLWRWITFLTWSVKDPKDVTSKIGDITMKGRPHNASMVVTFFDTRDQIKNPKVRAIDHGVGPLDETRLEERGFDLHTEMRVAPYCPPEISDMLTRDTSFARLAHSDWGGEIRYLLSVLGLLNARNVAETEWVDKAKQNKSRAKSGQPGLCSHTLLKIRTMHRRSFLGKRGSGTGEDIRKHFVSGHWKAKKNGLFWWNPHWRGRGEGVVTHDYEVRT